MKVENTLAKNLTAAGEKAAYDAACKRLLANKQILAWIMKSCLEEYKDYPVGEIAKKYIEGIPEISMTAVNSDETNANGESGRPETAGSAAFARERTGKEKENSGGRF